MNQEKMLKMIGALAVSMILGFILRFHNLALLDFDFWEALTIYEAVNLWKLPFQIRTSPPLFPILVTIWMRLTATEFWLRLLPFLAGFMLIPLMNKLSQRIFGEGNESLTVLTLTAISPYFVYISQLARHQSLLVLLSVITWLKLLDLLEEPSSRNMYLYAFSVTAMCYTGNMGWLVFLSQILYTICRGGINRQSIKKFCLALAGVIAMYLPFYKVTLNRLHYLMFEAQLPFGDSGPERILLCWQNLLCGYNASMWVYKAAVPVVAFLLVLGIIRLIRRWQALLFILAGVIVPSAGLQVISQLSSNNLIWESNWVCVLPIVFIGVGAGAGFFKRKGFQYILLSLFVVLWIGSLTNLASNIYPWEDTGRHPAITRKPNVKVVAQYILPRSKVAELVACSTPRTTILMKYYYNVYYKMERTVYTLDWEETIQKDVAQIFNRKWKEIPERLRTVANIVPARAMVPMASRFWYIEPLSYTTREANTGYIEVAEQVKSWCLENFRLAEVVEQGDYRLSLYVIRNLIFNQRDMNWSDRPSLLKKEEDFDFTW